MATIFYVYVVSKSMKSYSNTTGIINSYYRYITIKGIEIGSTKNVDKTAYWTNLKAAKSWESAIKNKFPDARLKKARLVVNGF